VHGIIEDVRAQGGDPDVVVSWLINGRSAQEAMREALFNYKIGFGLPSENSTGWRGYVSRDENGTESRPMNDVTYNMAAGQFHPGIDFKDPILGSTSSMVSLWRDQFGSPPNDRDATTAAAAVVVITGLQKFGAKLANLSIEERRTTIRYAIGAVNEETVSGVVAFNRFGQNTGGLPVTWQVLEDGSTVPVLPASAAPATLRVPAPSWDVRQGCPAGTYARQDPGEKVPTRCELCPEGTYRNISSSPMMQSECSVCPTGSGTMPGVVGAVECGLCPAGHFQNARLHLGVCAKCDRGRARSEGAPGDKCTPCSAGTYADEVGMNVCKTCPSGTQQFDQGQSFCTCQVGFFKDPKDPSGTGSTLPCLSCEDLLTGSSTQHPGASNSSDCGCSRGRYLRDDDDGGVRCERCQEGLECPFGSSLAVLEERGKAAAGAEQPFLLPGYFSLRDSPMEVYRCVPATWCGGGEPGACLGGRVDLACAECPEGSTWDGTKCSECAGETGAWIASFVVLSVVLLSAYYLLNSPVTAKASVMLATTCVMGMTVQMLQSLGIVGSIPVDWPSELSTIFDAMKVLLLDLDSLGFSCVAGSAPSRYASSGLFFPVAALMLVGLGVATQGLPQRLSRWKWQRAQTLNTIGQFFQVGFTTMSNVGLVPFMCYSHPTGSSSVQKYNAVLCGESEHVSMATVGALVVALGVSFLIAAMTLVFLVPTEAAKGNVQFLQSCRFLVFRFRTDVWWYGLVLIFRGPLLSLPAVILTDTARGQLLALTVVLITTLMLQLAVWPWKTPIVNVMDALISALLILTIATAGAFLPPATGATQDAFSTMSMAFVVLLGACVAVMCLLVVFALVRRGPMGSAQEMSILTLGRLPPLCEMQGKLETMCATLSELSRPEVDALLEAMSVYDLRNLGSVMTCIGNELGSDVAVKLRSSRRAGLVKASTKSVTRIVVDNHTAVPSSPEGPSSLDSAGSGSREGNGLGEKPDFVEL